MECCPCTRKGHEDVCSAKATKKYLHHCTLLLGGLWSLDFGGSKFVKFYLKRKVLWSVVLVLVKDMMKFALQKQRRNTYIIVH